MTPALFFFWAMLPLPTASLPTEALPIEALPTEALPAEAGPTPRADSLLPALFEESADTPEGECAQEAPLEATPKEEKKAQLPLVAWVPLLPLPEAAPSVDMVRFRFKMGDGFFIASADNASELRLRSMAQLRATFAFEGKDAAEFSARGVRILLEGRTLERRLVFVVHTSLGPDEFDGGSGLLDAWVSWKFGRDATLRVGQQRILFDQASGIRRLGVFGITRENFSHEFGLLRDVGLSLFSDDLLGHNEWLAYRIGLYGGQGRNRFSLNRSGFLAMARLTLRPFGFFDDTVDSDLERLDKHRLAVGISAAYDNNISRTGGHLSAHFDNLAFPATMNASYWNVDAMYKWKGLYVAGQYTRRVTSRAFVENDTDRVWGRSGHGYVLKASGMLTRRWELLGRFSQQFGIGQTDPRLLDEPRNELVAGLNHYFIGHALKAQLEYAARFDKNVRTQNWLRLQLQVVF